MKKSKKIRQLGEELDNARRRENNWKARAIKAEYEVTQEQDRYRLHIEADIRKRQADNRISAVEWRARAWKSEQAFEELRLEVAKHLAGKGSTKRLGRLASLPLDKAPAKMEA